MTASSGKRPRSSPSMPTIWAGSQMSRSFCTSSCAMDAMSPSRASAITMRSSFLRRSSSLRGETQSSKA